MFVILLSIGFQPLYCQNCNCGNPEAGSQSPVGIAEKITLHVTGSPHNASCADYSDGYINITPTGNASKYTYAWSNGKTTRNISNLGAGTYTVTVTDVHLCSATGSWTVGEPAALTLTGSATPASCHNSGDGMIDIAVSGGTPFTGTSTPYHYLWSTTDTIEDISGLLAGAYTVTVTDAHNCTVSSNWVVTQPGEISWAVNTSPVSCYGGADGAVTTTFLGGGNPPYYFQWSNGATTQNISGLATGIYFSTITDSRGCDAWIFVYISQPPVLSVSVTAIDVLCYGGYTGSATGNASGGTPPYSYSWSNGETTSMISALSQGCYFLTVTDARNCTSTGMGCVFQPSMLMVTGQVTNSSCNTYCDGSVNLDIYGGSPGYTYQWSNGATTQNAAGLCPGPYTITVTDANGCASVSSWLVEAVTEVCQVNYIQNINVTGNQCFDALETILVAGPPPFYPSSFYVQSGGHVNMVAGNKIEFYPRTRAYSGSYLHARIAPSGPWCGSKAACLTAVADQTSGSTMKPNESFFTIYPNPTAGEFTVELKSFDPADETRVNIYGMHGELIYRALFPGAEKYHLTLDGHAKGIYFIRIVCGNLCGTGKIIRQ